MKPSEEIQAQIDALMGDYEWVQINDGFAESVQPSSYACAVVRWKYGDCVGQLDHRVRMFVRRALDSLHPDRRQESATAWNDYEARSVNEVIEVLERARKLALIEEEQA